MLNFPTHPCIPLGSSQFANLYTFLVAARQLSFSRAADELCITTSAVSHRIRRLEQALAIRLFERLTRQVRLTPDGERLLELLQSTMDGLADIVRHPGPTGVGGSLAVYARPSFAQSWLVPRLADFTRRYPAVSINLRVGNDTIDFRHSMVDVALYYANGDFPGLASHRLMTERLAPVCSPEYAASLGLLDNPAKLAGATLLHDACAWEHAAYDAEWKLWAAQYRLADKLPVNGLTFDRSDLAVSAALHHAGVAMGREQLVQPWVEQGRLVLPFGGFERVGDYDYYVVYPRQTTLKPSVQVFVDWLVEQTGQVGKKPTG